MVELGPPWEVSEHRFLFHYAPVENALAIAHQRRFVVGPGQDFGTGMYATDIAPGELPDRELLEILFAEARSSQDVDGVVVMTRHPALSFDEVASRVWLHRAERGAIVDLSVALVGAGERVAGDWRFNASVPSYLDM